MRQIGRCRELSPVVLRKLLEEARQEVRREAEQLAGEVHHRHAIVDVERWLEQRAPQHEEVAAVETAEAARHRLADGECGARKGCDVML